MSGGAFNARMGEIVIMAGTALFSGNKAWLGRAIHLTHSEMLCINAATVLFEGNLAEHGSGVDIAWSSVDTSRCSFNYFNNFATESGGAVSIGYSTELELYSLNVIPTILTGNYATNRAKLGGAVTIINELNVTLTSSIFTGNSATALSILDSSVVFYKTSFINNTGNLGGAISSQRSLTWFDGYNLFQGNTALSGGAIYLLHGKASFDGVVVFTQNSAGGDGGALYIVGTAIHLDEIVNFTFNTAHNGGAVCVKNEAVITLGIKAHFYSSFNVALRYGGGI